MKRNTKILVIDDEENYLFILKEILTEEGYTVQTSNDASLALLLLDKESYDIVITDVKMSKCSGKDVAQHVNKLYPDTPIIVITAFGSIENAISFMKSGVFHYLTKPFENEELIRTVHNASELVFARKQYKNLYNSIHNKKVVRYPLVAHTQCMKQLTAFLDTIEESSANILIEGERGVGKKYIASYIHERSLLHRQPLHIVRIEGKEEQYLEKYLFDAETGLISTTTNNILLEGIESMPYRIQVKLSQYIARNIEERKRTLRIFSTSRISLEESVKSGLFHADLYYYLAILHIKVPALRQRRDDIPYLAVELMKEIATEEKGANKRFSPEVIQYLTHYEWHGNIKELQTILRRIFILTQDEEIRMHHLPPELQEEHTRFTSAVDLLPLSLNLADTLEKIEEQLIRRALVHCNFVQSRAARLLGISKSRLQYKLMKYEIAGHQLTY